METLKLEQIRCNGGTQSRAFMDETAISEYAQAILGGAQFPPVVVFYDGTEYWMADGFHRWRAHKDAGQTEILADVKQGDVRNAILYSVGANAISQVNRTASDMRRAVTVLLEDKEWSEWSNVQVAGQCRVSEGFVRLVKKEMGLTSHHTKYIHPKTGQVTTMKTGEIGKKEGETGTGQNPSPNVSPAVVLSQEGEHLPPNRNPIESSDAERQAPDENGSEWPTSEWTNSNTQSINANVEKNIVAIGRKDKAPPSSAPTLTELCLELVENHVAILASTPEAREWFARLVQALESQQN